MLKKSAAREILLENKEMVIKMRFTSNKKADTHMWWIIMAAVLALIVVILLLIWFKGSGETAFGSISQNIAGTGDCDEDKIPNMFDNCPCDAEESGAKVSGCPAGVKDKTDTLTTQKVGKDCCEK